MTDPGAAQRALRPVYACYALSGALGLAYQVLWLRQLLLVFGSTVHAVSAVLTVFFGGLALGSWMFGRLIDHRGAAVGLRWYAVLELGVGLYAFATLPLFRVVQELYLPLYQRSDFNPQVLLGGSFACTTLVLLLPTTLMGGTFPVLSRFLIRTREERGGKIALLYALNTAGAMAGTLGVYYVGLPVLGLARSLACAGVLNLGVGALCFIADRKLRAIAPAAPVERADDGGPGALAQAAAGDGRTIRWLLAAFGLSGFSAMVYEVAWTRTLSLVLGSSIYAFCVMLAAFLGGMALGSFWVRQDLRRAPAKINQFIVVELALGVYGLFSLWFFNQLPDWFAAFWPMTGGSFAGLTLLQLFLSAASMLFPTLMMGVLFPLVGDLVTGRFAQLGQRLGTAYAVNTAGGILGSFLSGFMLIPWLGLPGAIIVAGLVNLLAGVLVFIRFGSAGSPRLRTAAGAGGLAAAAAVAVFGLLPGWQRQAMAAGVYLNPEGYRNAPVAQAAAKFNTLLFYRDSLNATVSVHQSADTLFLKVGGKTDASNGLDMGTQTLSAHLPLLLHGSAKRVLVVGLGSGVTLGQAGRYPVATLHCAELDPAVIEAARFFKEYNDRIHDDPRVRIIPADGRNFLLATKDPYDVIISEPSNPWMAGVGYLFTRQYYELARSRLAEGGIMCQWLQLYHMFPQDVKLLLKTFRSVFPNMSVWAPIPGDLLLVGSLRPHQLSAATLAERMAQPKVRDGLARIYADRPDLLLELFLLDTAGVDEATADMTWVHDDDQPWVEFSAPKALYADQTFRLNSAGLAKLKRSPAAVVPDYVPLVRTAADWLAVARLWRFREDLVKELEALEQAVRLDPAQADAWRQIGEAALRGQQPLRAFEAFSHAAAARPEPDTYRDLARLYWQQDAKDDSLRLYYEACSLRPPDSALAEEVGQRLQIRKAFAPAAEFYRSAVSQGGGSKPGALAGFADALKEQGARAEAEQVLRYGVGAFPDEQALLVRLGQLLLDGQRWDEAEPWLAGAARLASPSPDAYYGLARAALARGKERAARQALRQALQRQPYHQESLRLLRELQGAPQT